MRSATFSLVVLQVLLGCRLVLGKKGPKKVSKAEAFDPSMGDMMFKMMDKDGDGFLSRTEVEEIGKAAASGNGAKAFDGEKAPGGLIFDKFDADKDGKVTREEAKAIFAKISEAVKAEPSMGAAGGSKRRKARRRQRQGFTAQSEL
eukprot:UN4832